MHSPSIWPGNDAVPESIADDVHAIPACVRRHAPARIPTITRRHERHDLAIATIRGALEALDLHPEQRDRIMADIEATAAEVGP